MRLSKLAIFHGPGLPFTLETVRVPELREGEILVRNQYTAICRSDLNTFSGRRTEPTPTILGHETVGIIEERMPDAPARDCRGATLRVGDRVTWALYASDPDSWLARQGIPQKAPGLFKYGHEPITAASTLHGGLAEYCILRKHTPLIRIDAPVPLPLLALINCSVATVAGSLRLAGELEDRNVIITGAGMLGVVACAMCRCAGARQIIAADIDETRLSTAATFGADFVINLKTSQVSLAESVAAALSGESVAVALDYSGAPESMEAMIQALGVGGTAILVGATYPQRALQVSAESLIRKVHTLKGLHNYNERDLAAAVEFMEQHHQSFPFGDLVLDRFDLETVNQAFQCGLNSNVYRAGVRIIPKSP